MFIRIWVAVLPARTVQRMVYPVDLTGVEQELEDICAKLRLSKAEAIRSAINAYHEQLKGVKVIELRKIPRARAEREILAVVREKGTAYADEIADELRLDVFFVNDVLKKLAEKGVVK